MVRNQSRGKARLREHNTYQSLAGRHKTEVNKVRRDPHRPRPHHRRRQIILNLSLDVRKRLALGHAEVGEEHDAEAWVPQELIDSHLRSNGLHGRARDLLVKPAVEVVAGGSVNQETKGTQTEGTHHVVALLLVGHNEFLGEDVTEGEAREGGHSLNQQRVCLQCRIVLRPQTSEHDFEGV